MSSFLFYFKDKIRASLLAARKLLPRSARPRIARKVTTLLPLKKQLGSSIFPFLGQFLASYRVTMKQSIKSCVTSGKIGTHRITSVTNAIKLPLDFRMVTYSEKARSVIGK